MKLYELLTEAPKKDAYAAKSFFGNDANAKKIVLARGKKVAEFIKSKCAPWYKESNKGKVKFYRGFAKGANEVAFTKKVRTNRRPKDSGAREHDAFNTLIKLGGGKANRSNAVFASSELFVAEEYGQAFVVIPIGQYTYTWHNYYDDWTGQVPWGELLTIKQKKEAKGKKSKVELEYEDKRAENEKTLNQFRAMLKKVFTDNGIKAPTPSQWFNMSYDIDDITKYKEGTFAGGHGVKFKNVQKGKKPFIKDGYYSKDKWQKHWVGLYNHLATLPEAKRGTYVTLLKKIDKQVRPAHQAYQWLKKYKDLNAYKLMYTSNHGGYGSHGASAKTWLPSKHKPSSLDKENSELKRFLKGLQVDKNLEAARRSGHEIMIKSTSVLGVDVQFYQKVVLPMLDGKQPKITDTEALLLLHPAKNNDDW